MVGWPAQLTIQPGIVGVGCADRAGNDQQLLSTHVAADGRSRSSLTSCSCRPPSSCAWTSACCERWPPCTTRTAAFRSVRMHKPFQTTLQANPIAGCDRRRTVTRDAPMAFRRGGLRARPLSITPVSLRMSARVSTSERWRADSAENRERLRFLERPDLEGSRVMSSANRSVLPNRGLVDALIVCQWPIDGQDLTVADT